jgi:hypothetical protein
MAADLDDVEAYLNQSQPSAPGAAATARGLDTEVLAPCQTQQYAPCSSRRSTSWSP